MSNQLYLLSKFFGAIILILLLPLGCAAPVVEYPVSAKRVANQSTTYQQTQYEGQLSRQNSTEIKKRYPPGLQREKTLQIPLEQQVRVSFRLFSSNPSQPDTAKMVTDTLVNVFVQSNMFNIVERENLSQLVTELELNQSGLINQDNAPETGQFSATDVIITGVVDQLGDNLITANVLEVSSGRIVLSERITPAAITRLNAEMLARRLIDRMKEKFYNTH